MVLRGGIIMKGRFHYLTIMSIFLAYFIAVIFNSDFWGNLLSPVVTGIAAYYVYKAYVKSAKNRIMKIAGIFFFASIAAWAIGDAAWVAYDMLLHIDPDEMALTTYGYSLTNLFFVIWLIISGIQELKRWNMVQVLVDTVAISINCLILIWVFFLNKDMQNVLLLQSDVVSGFSVLLDFIIMIWTFIWYFSIRKGKIPHYMKYAPLGAIIFVVMDLIYYYQYFYTIYDPNSLLDGGYVLGLGLLGYSGYLKVYSKAEITTEFENRGGRNKGILLIIAPLLLVIFKGLQVDYLLMMVLTILLHYVFSNITQKNIFRDELLEKELQLNAKLERKVAERTKELNALLDQDVVTGLKSRRCFLRELRQILDSSEKETHLILFYIDLNRYKMIKTMFGNFVGEQVLKEVGESLSDYFHGKNALLASYGEDVYVIVLQGRYTYDEGEEIAAGIIEECSRIYHVDGYDIRVTLNAGIAIYPTDASSKSELIRHADIAMSEARKNGFNKVQSFDEELEKIVSNKNRIEILLKRACFDDEFTLNYQPQVMIEDGSMFGMEALIRWKTPDGRMISPGEFIPIAEETGYIIPIGYWVMQKALEQLHDWDKVCEQKPRMSINVSAKQLIERDFIKNLSEALIRNQIAPDRLEIEITESSQLEENQEIKDKLIKIHEMGVSIAIDDFGTGYSSLYYLKNLPIDRIKIAKPLIDKIESDIYDNTIVKTAITVAKTRNMRIIAEGVETKEQWEALKEIQCDEIQGYYFARPMPADQIYAEWMQR